jgi:hypothetical protein
MANTLMVLGLILFVVLLVAGLVWRRRSATVFCPVWERMVEIKGERCLAREDGRFVVVGSIWECPRRCLDQPEAKDLQAMGRV